MLTRRIPHTGMRRGEQFEEVVEKAKIPNLRWHDLRHTFASRLVMAGLPLRAVQTLANGDNPKVIPTSERPIGATLSSVSQRSQLTPKLAPSKMLRPSLGLLYQP